MGTIKSLSSRLVRVVRFRSDDPLRYLHVFAGERIDDDDGTAANALEGGDDTEGLESARESPGAVVSEDDLA